MPDMTDHQRACMMRLAAIAPNAKPMDSDRRQLYLNLIDQHDAETFRDAIDHLVGQGQHHIPDPGLLAEACNLCKVRRQRETRTFTVAAPVKPALRDVARAGLAQARAELEKVRAS